MKERVEAKKNKLIPALIGVTKSSVVKLDMETKDILKEWKLTQLRRWAASPNSFTLDFGDYAEAYYSVQTTEGDQISQLIAGYIDIILKKRKEAEKVVVEDEVEETSVEEYIKPTKATNFVSVVSNGHRTASESKFVPLAVAPGGIPGQVNGSMASLDERYAQQNFEKQPAYIAEQQALIMAIRNALQMIKGTANDLNQPTNLPPIGNDPAAVAWKEQTIDANTVNIANQIAAQLASSASIMNNAYGPPESLDFELLCSNVASLTTNLSQMCPALKLVAALTDDGDSLLEAALLLVKSTVNLLNSAQMIAVGDSSVRTELHSAGKDLAVDAFDVLLKMGRAEILEDEQLDIENMMTGVVKAVMDLVSNAKSVSKTISDPQAQQNIVSDAKFAFETCQNLNACVSAVVPEINILQCTDQVMEGAVLLRDAIGMLANSCGISTNMEAVDSLMDAAQRVEEAIARLIEKGISFDNFSIKSRNKIGRWR